MATVLWNLSNPPENWEHLKETVLGTYLMDSLILVAGTVLLSVLAGVSCARWLVTCCDFSRSKIPPVGSRSSLGRAHLHRSVRILRFTGDHRGKDDPPRDLGPNPKSRELGQRDFPSRFPQIPRDHSRNGLRAVSLRLPACKGFLLQPRQPVDRGRQDIRLQTTIRVFPGGPAPRPARHRGGSQFGRHGNAQRLRGSQTLRGLHLHDRHFPNLAWSGRLVRSPATCLFAHAFHSESARPRTGPPGGSQVRRGKERRAHLPALPARPGRVGLGHPLLPCTPGLWVSFSSLAAWFMGIVNIRKNLGLDFFSNSFCTAFPWLQFPLSWLSRPQLSSPLSGGTSRTPRFRPPTAWPFSAIPCREPWWRWPCSSFPAKST